MCNYTGWVKIIFLTCMGYMFDDGGEWVCWNLRYTEVQLPLVCLKADIILLKGDERLGVAIMNRYAYKIKMLFIYAFEEIKKN